MANRSLPRAEEILICEEYIVSIPQNMWWSRPSVSRGAVHHPHTFQLLTVFVYVGCVWASFEGNTVIRDRKVDTRVITVLVKVPKRCTYTCNT